MQFFSFSVNLTGATGFSKIFFFRAYVWASMKTVLSTNSQVAEFVDAYDNRAAVPLPSLHASGELKVVPEDRLVHG